MLPHFFRHYDPVVDRYFILDNGSTDGSLALLDAHPKVTVGHFDVSGDSFVDTERRISDSVWRKSRGKADWVILLDIDEFIFRPDLVEYLNACTRSGITALQAIGYEMVADRFPTDDTPLVDALTTGVRSAGHDKLCVFNPDALVETDFAPGRHQAAPKGRVVWPPHPELLMLHYKQLGVEYTIQRSAELRLGLREGDVQKGWGTHYLWSPAEIAVVWSKLRAAAGPVPGLGSLRRVEPKDYDEERVVTESGLFDAPWYLSAYPDVSDEKMNALSHYCIHGWKEGRRPNFYFQPSWYLENTPAAGKFVRNPLLHYFLHGERAGARPSPWFEPAWYRENYRIGAAQSPLAHYLAHRASGQYSPNPDFDVQSYCATHPNGAWRDPFEESLPAAKKPTDAGAAVKATAAAAGDAAGVPVVAAADEELTQPAIPAYGAIPSHEAIPTYEEVLATMGSDSDELREVLRPFIGYVVVDEQRYLRAYPDVAAAVDEGAIGSGREHYIGWGYFEGRSPQPDPPDET